MPASAKSRRRFSWRDLVHLEAIPDDASEWKVPIRSADRLAATLRAEREDAMLYRKLATLVTDVPIGEALEGLRYKGETSRLDAWRRDVGLY